MCEETSSNFAENFEEQKNELLVLKEIFGEDSIKIFAQHTDEKLLELENELQFEINGEFFQDSKHILGGTISVSAESSDCATKITWQSIGQDNVPKHSIEVKFLPPVIIEFSNPPDYPSQSCPAFQLKCSWLTQSQLEALTCKFTELWNENCSLVILFVWCSFVKDQLFDLLNLTCDNLDLTDLITEVISIVF